MVLEKGGNPTIDFEGIHFNGIDDYLKLKEFDI